MKILLENLKEINENSELYSQGRTSVQMGLNEYSDFTDDEYKELKGRKLSTLLS